MPLRALDLFCCAGGASKGLQQAGFHVTGVDVSPQPNYCGDDFLCADVMEVAEAFQTPGASERFELSDFDFVWASPPCQRYTALQNTNKNSDAHPDYIEHLRNWLRLDADRYVIENVPGAPLEANLTLCGTMFGLGAEGCQLHRHRIFECIFDIEQPRCQHAGPVIGVYGGHARRRAASAGGRGTRDIWNAGHRGAASKAMGIDWMTLAEMSEAIPPAYAEHIGRAAIEHILAARKAA